ncbi:hypothetical protein BVRB_9g226080 isoform B [Beta vulgaris subsp. vulgaris]|uniref:Uncharacterized protein n=1 Tax=Beta vulgaris subsp. vulgaris TaxID=3555 RepID=A0A0J8B8N5_BETVV|nr:uncharacterized protein LOC104883314 isoform X2 [Beta vulgaris subsp. vulgaris]KMS96338.1 hypothetical protein BVRB_9g226080 isoform B [Beta vulgaris subsp. vulgaris]
MMLNHDTHNNALTNEYGVSYCRLLDARHADVVLPDPREEKWNWQIQGQHIVQRHTEKSRLSMYDANYNSSETADALWPISECMGNFELMQARKLITLHGASTTISNVFPRSVHRIIFEVLVRRSEDGNAIGLRIVETMDLVPKHSMF